MAPGLRLRVPLFLVGLLLGPLVARAQPAPQRFDIDEFRVEGNTLLPSDEIESTVYEFLGPGKTRADVERARAALDALYSSKGYPTVSAEIPRQSIDSGVIVLKVTERKVGRLRVTGSRYYALSDIKNGAPSLAEGSVPNINDVKRDIIALNQLPDRSVTPVLKAGRAPDTVDVDLQVNDSLPLHGSLELNNRQGPDTTPLRLSGSLSYDNLWQRGDSGSLFFQVAPQNPSDATVGSGSYLFHIPDSRLSLLGSFLKSNSNVTTVGTTNVIGKGEIAGIRLLVPLTQEAGFVQTLSLGFDYKHFIQGVSLTGQSTNTPITYYPFAVTYQGDWSSEHAQTDLTANLIVDMRELGSDTAAFDANRYGASPSFAYVRGLISHLQMLPHDVQIYLRAQGQGAVVPLVPYEQFGLGGLDTVRGYLESEWLGDYGAVLQSELRSPSLAGAIGPQVNDLRLHVFGDVGSAAINQPLPEQRSGYTLGSVGGGLRMRMFDHVNGEVQDAVTLANGPSTKAGTNRVLFRLYGSF
jgi:hemolysin activation/secretion protein